MKKRLKAQPPASVASIIICSVLGLAAGIWISIAGASSAKVRDPVPAPALTPETAPPRPSRPDKSKPLDIAARLAAWKIDRSAGLAGFARFCLSAAANDPDNFAEAIEPHLRDLRIPEIEAAIWALSQHRPDLAAGLAAGLKNPWLCKKLANSIAGGIPPGNDRLLNEVMITLKLPATARQSLLSSAASDRAESDPAWAASQLKSAQTSLQQKQAILCGLARTDLQRCLALARPLNLPPFVISSLLGEAANSRLPEALKIAGEFSDSSIPANFLNRVLYGRKGSFSDSELNSISRLAAENSDSSAAGPSIGKSVDRGLTKVLLDRDPEQAIEAFERLPDGGARIALLPDVALAASGHDWRRALDWVIQAQSDGDRSDRHIYGQFSWEWVRADPEGLQRTLINDSSVPASARDYLLSTLNEFYQMKGEQAHQQWLSTLPPSLRPAPRK